MGIEPAWQRLCEGDGAVARIERFDPAGFDCRIAAEIHDFKVTKFVPKSYRKATKVMAREIAFAVAAADLAARDASLVTQGTAEGDEPRSYDAPRMGAQVGAGLIAADLDELTGALAEARDDGGRFDIHQWGREGLTHLTPLWLLKYLPNMLACHVTIIHDAQGPSNTITCGESSGTLSLGESLRVIRRGAADLCFCGGTDTKLNPMAFLRQLMTGQINTSANDAPEGAVRPFCRTAQGTVIGEGGAIFIVEALDSFERRAGGRAYCEVLGFGASQTVHPESRNARPDPEGRGIGRAIAAALRDAGVEPQRIDAIVPFGLGVAEIDEAEARALQRVFGSRLGEIPLAPVKSMAGTCGAGAGALDLCVAAKMIHEQRLPAVVNCAEPREGLRAGNAGATPADIGLLLACCCGIGGQNAAVVLGKVASSG